MRTAILGLAALSLLSWSDPAAAAPKAKRPAPAASCMKTAQTQLDLNACAAQQAQAADARLNKSYQAVLCHLQPDEKAQLQAAERAWIAYRDADCAFWGGGGGSIAPMNALMCRAARSDERAKALDAWPPNAPRSALGAC